MIIKRKLYKSETKIVEKSAKTSKEEPLNDENHFVSEALNQITIAPLGKEASSKPYF